MIQSLLAIATCNGITSLGVQEEEPAVLRDLSKEQLQLREAFSVPGTQADWVSMACLGPGASALWHLASWMIACTGCIWVMHGPKLGLMLLSSAAHNA
jgi:hypothetical protein